jgi:hypothetical protein
LEFKEGVEHFYHTYNHEDMMEPYEPFIGIIGDIIKKYELDLDQLLEKAEVYSLHREIFQSYFLNGRCERFENVVLSELEYESGRFVEGILNLLEQVSKVCPIMIMLNKVNQVTSSSLYILKCMLERDFSNIKILGIVNQLRSVSLYVNEEYNEFISVCEERTCINDWINDFVMEENPEAIDEDKAYCDVGDDEHHAQVRDKLHYSRLNSVV